MTAHWEWYDYTNIPHIDHDDARTAKIFVATDTQTNSTEPIYGEVLEHVRIDVPAGVRFDAAVVIPKLIERYTDENIVGIRANFPASVVEVCRCRACHKLVARGKFHIELCMDCSRIYKRCSKCHVLVHDGTLAKTLPTDRSGRILCPECAKLYERCPGCGIWRDVHSESESDEQKSDKTCPSCRVGRRSRSSEMLDHYRSGDIDYVHDYSHKPYPRFHAVSAEPEPHLYFGVELEVDDFSSPGAIRKASEALANMKGNIGEPNHLGVAPGSCPPDPCDDCDHVVGCEDWCSERSEWENDYDYDEEEEEENGNEELFYLKYDASLNDGFEIVTHPSTLAFHRQSMPWAQIKKIVLSAGGRSHDTNHCGLHVHMNSNFFGTPRSDEWEMNVLKLLNLNSTFWRQIVRISRRRGDELDEWAARYADDFKVTPGNTRKIKDLLAGGHGRHRAINLHPRETIEFRMFKGTLNDKTLIATLQFLDHFIRTAKTLSAEQTTNITWDGFITKLNKDFNKELSDYLMKAKLYGHERGIAKSAS